MSKDELRKDRRKFLGAAAGAAALGSWAPWAQSKPGGRLAPIVFKDTLSAQHFSIRDAITRPDRTLMGYLGRAELPHLHAVDHEEVS